MSLNWKMKILMPLWRGPRTSSALKKGLQVADKLVDHFLGISHFMDRYLKLRAWVSIVVKAQRY